MAASGGSHGKDGEFFFYFDWLWVRSLLPHSQFFHFLGLIFYFLSHCLRCSIHRSWCVSNRAKSSSFLRCHFSSCSNALRNCFCRSSTRTCWKPTAPHRARPSWDRNNYCLAKCRSKTIKKSDDRLNFWTVFLRFWISLGVFCTIHLFIFIFLFVLGFPLSFFTALLLSIDILVLACVFTLSLVSFLCDSFLAFLFTNFHSRACMWGYSFLPSHFASIFLFPTSQFLFLKWSHQSKISLSVLMPTAR